MATDPKMMKAADFAKVSEVDFVSQFAKSIRVLQEVLGITRKIEKVPGQVIKTYKVEGTLESGVVAEGEVIPLSKYNTTVAQVFELTVKKYRKQTTLEAINDKGYDQAVADTDVKMVKDIQGTIKADFFSFLSVIDASVSGTNLQGALAKAWGQMQVLYEDSDASGYIYFVNPLDIADSLATATVTTQTAFGMTYIQAFLGTYDLLVYSGVPQGSVIATAKNNIILYYTNPANSDLAKVFNFTTDETGLVGVAHDVHYDNLATDTVAISGLKLFAELESGIVVASIGPEVTGITATPATGALVVGGTVTPTIAVTGTGNFATTWTAASSDTAVATVSAAGLVTAIGAGTAVITFTATGDTTEKATYTVTVTAAEG